MSFLEDIGIARPIIQAPMAGISTPELAAAVSNAGGLGSIGIGATHAIGAKAMIEEVRVRTDRPFNVNVFVHAAPSTDTTRERRWLQALAPEFDAFDATPPAALETIYQSFADDDEMFELLMALRPPVISFHFGLPPQDKIEALKAAGCKLLSTATNLDEAVAAEQAGVDAVVAQGYEAGGHRGVFDPKVPDQKLGIFALVQLLVAKCALPVVAAGGIMDGRGIASVMALGAEAAQLGTAFVGCPESKADIAYREALKGAGAYQTIMTTAISGRPARCLSNRFTAWAAEADRLAPPDYPRAYDAGKALHAAAKSQGEFGFGAQWAGQGAPLMRELSAADLVEALMLELKEARSPFPG